MKVVKPFVVRHGGAKSGRATLPGVGDGSVSTASTTAASSVVGPGSRNAVYSLDFQPGSLRIATAGGDTTVKIWDGNLLLSGPAEAIQNDALLATLEFHEKSVNCVRWSRCGSMLASGSDDGYVLVYRQAPAEEMRMHLFGSESARSKENWVRQWTLHGHHMDVLGVAWSPDGALASCSVDNTVMIWDIVSPALAGNSVGVRGGVLAPRVTLRGHASFVKGVAFDPVGRLLASCGADDVVIIWSTETWAEVARITEPLKDSVDNTIFRRIDWAPDGGSLCLSAAVKACKPLAAVIQRSTWSCVADLVGHDVATTCARFHGKLVVADDAGGSGGGGARAVPSCVVAVGDQRGVVSIWTTRKNVPLVVIKDIFSDAIVDMSWSSLPAGSDTGRGGDGAVLGMCSLDGTVALVEIDRPEGKQRNSSLLGKEITGSALEDHFVRMYGKKLEDLLSSNPRSSLPAAAKSKIVLAAHKNALAPVAVMYPSQSTSSIRSLSVKSSAPSLSMSSPSTATPSLNAAFGASAISRSTTSTPVIPDKTVPGPALVRQAESRRASDGKKRITPVALDAPGSSSSSSSHEMTMDTSLKRTRVSFQDSASPSFSSGGMDSTRDDNILEKRPSSIAPCTIQGADISSTTPEESAKSDRPIGLGVSTPLPSAVTSAINAASTGNDSSRSRPMADRLGPDLNLKSGEILYAFKSDTLFSRSWVQTLGAEASGSIWQDIFQSSYCSLRLYVSVVRRPAMLSRMTVGASSSPLPALGVPANVSIVSLLHARRSAAPHSSSSCEAVAYEPLWTTFLTSRCSAIGVMVSSTSHADSTDTNALCGVAALGFMDGSIQFLSLQSGLRLAPALSLGAPVVSLSCLSSDQQNYRHRCLAVCADGECYVWTVTSSGTMMAAMGRQAHTSPDDAVKLLFKTSIRPTISSLRSIHAEGASSSLSTAQGGSDGEASFLVEDVYIAPRTLRPVPSGQQQLEPFTGSDGGVALFVSIACLVASSLSTTAAATSSVSCSDGLLEERAVFEYLPGPGAWSQVPHTHRFLESSVWAPDPRLEAALQTRRSNSLPRARPDMPASGGADVAAVARMASAMLPRQQPFNHTEPSPVHRDFSAEVCEAAVASSCSWSGGGVGGGQGCALEPPAPAEWSAMLQLCATEEMMARLLSRGDVLLPEDLSAGPQDPSQQMMQQMHPRLEQTMTSARGGAAEGLGACLERWVGLSCQLGNVAGIKIILDDLLHRLVAQQAEQRSQTGTAAAAAARRLLERHLLPALGRAAAHSAAAQDLLVATADALAVTNRS